MIVPTTTFPVEMFGDLDDRALQLKRFAVNMCGRYRFTLAQRYAELNEIRRMPALTPRFSIQPASQVAVVLDESPDTISELRWGLIPIWAEDTRIGDRLINAEVETVSTKPAFRDAFKYRRCLVAADGFFAWQKVGTRTQPYNICLKTGEPFSFAGLWENWRSPEGENVRSCTIITCEPNNVMFRIGAQMPVILPLSKTKEWLDPAASNEDLLSLLVPYSSAQMIAYPISSAVGAPEN
jgi:putative SOS response-associated peptidase YedK